VRSYAEYLGIDTTAAITDYLREEHAQGLDEEMDKTAILEAMARQAGFRGSGSRLPRPTSPMVLLLLAAATALAASAWWLLGRPAAPTPPPPAPPPGRVAAPPPALPVPAPPAPAQPGEAATASPPQPADPPVEPPPEPDPAPASHLTVSEFGAGMEVVDRNLVGAGDRFREGTLIWFWTRVLGGEQGDIVEHVWLKDGRQMASHAITLGGAHWRVYTRHTLLPGAAGAWAVEARDASGRVLARDEFEVVAN
jgi:hypothetical protein